MSKKYFVSAAGRDFAVTFGTADPDGRVRLRIDSEIGSAEREGRLVGGSVEIDGRMLKLESLSELVQLGNRQHRLELSVSDRPRLAITEGVAATRARHRVLKAPLPGQVASVLVSTGDRVRAGQRLLLIEAMKMQNPILAERDGTVLQVFVSTGDAVQVGARLVDVGD
ncbi:MAG TPA: biotin/lipoyl-containing protein [Polyangiaceae bacterium]|nr:biotin/lipoyl-containing protein [Polyangiaceae bacterium]